MGRSPANRPLLRRHANPHSHAPVSDPSWPMVVGCAAARRIVRPAPWRACRRRRTAQLHWLKNPFANDDPVGTPGWWKENKKDRGVRTGQGLQGRRRRRLLRRRRPAHQGPVATERIIKAGDDEDDEVGLIPGLDPRVQYDKMKAAVGLGPNEQFARDAYAEGERLFQRERSIGAAAKKFKEAVDRGPHSPIEQDAMFMLAESYFFDDRYIKARDAYDALVKEYPNTRYMDTLIDREWKIAQLLGEVRGLQPRLAADAERLRQDAAVVRHDRPRDQDVRKHPAERPDRSAGGRCDHGDGEHLFPPRPVRRRRLPLHAAADASIRAASCNSRPICWACRPSCANTRAPTTTARRSKRPRQLVKQLRMQFAGRLSPEEKERLRDGRRPAQSGNRHARLSHGRVLRRHQALRRGAILLRPGDQEVSRTPSWPSRPRDRLARSPASPTRRRSDWHGSSICFPRAASDRAWREIPELQRRRRTRLAEAPDQSGTRRRRNSGRRRRRRK